MISQKNEEQFMRTACGINTQTDVYTEDFSLISDSQLIPHSDLIK